MIKVLCKILCVILCIGQLAHAKDVEMEPRRTETIVSASAIVIPSDPNDIINLQTSRYATMKKIFYVTTAVAVVGTSLYFVIDKLTKKNTSPLTQQPTFIDDCCSYLQSVLPGLITGQSESCYNTKTPFISKSIYLFDGYPNFCNIFGDEPIKRLQGGHELGWGAVCCTGEFESSFTSNWDTEHWTCQPISEEYFGCVKPIQGTY